MANLKILYASSEVFPLIKTGGLADVAQSLPIKLHSMGEDIRIILPFYQSTNCKASSCEKIASFEVDEQKVELLKTHLPGSSVEVMLVDCPRFFAREGNPYLDENGLPWDDNANRFAFFSKVICLVAQNKININWLPDIVHCNDWQTGLALALLRNSGTLKGLVFTIHNIAYQGIFPRQEFTTLKLPTELWSIDILEYYGQMSFLKAGITSCNQLNTVSEKFSEEIQTSEFGFGMDGLLQSVSHKLSGILNGIDIEEWSPKNDEHLISNYDIDNLALKQNNKLHIQKQFSFEQDINIPLLVTVTRLVEQKGIDLIIDIIEKLLTQNVQVIVLGSGENAFEVMLQKITKKHQNKFSAVIGYNETLAHQLTAAADMYLMPSRFEPCGLNQMYSQVYGTVPIVRETGGLADTVINYTNDNSSTNATGFMFKHSVAEELYETIQIALLYYSDKKLWTAIQKNAMQQDFSWEASANKYLSIYQKSLQ